VPSEDAKRDSKNRFSDRVEFYVRSRPRYPQAFLEFCKTKLGLLPRHHLADIGSGTGFLSELFVRNGYDVTAIEPNAPMRAAGEALLGDDPHFHSKDTTAEVTGLEKGSIDFVLAGQAFHWFDRVRCRAEFKRILRPTGWVVLVWNERRSDAAGFAHHYEEIVRKFETDLAHVAHQNITARESDAMAEFFQPAGYAVASFDNPQFLDLDGVIARALSSSYLPLPGQPGCEEMLEALHEAFEDHAGNGKVRLDYDTKAFYGHLV
jgi:SAM-dependent methyltransferase